MTDERRTIGGSSAINVVPIHKWLFIVRMKYVHPLASQWISASD